MCIFLDSLILDSDMICVIYISIYIMGSIPRGLDFLKSPSCGKSTRGPVRCLTRFWMHPSPSTVISFLWLPVCLLLRCKWGRLFTSIEKVFVSCRNTLSFKIIYLHEHFGARVKSSPRLLSLFAGATCEHVKRSCLWSVTFVDFHGDDSEIHGFSSLYLCGSPVGRNHATEKLWSKKNVYILLLLGLQSKELLYNRLKYCEIAGFVFELQPCFTT